MADGVPARKEARTILEEIDEVGVVRAYLARRIVFAQGDPADAVFFLQRGNIKASLTSPQGKEAVIAIVEPGDFFGEGCLAGQSVRLMTATVLSPSSVLRIEKAAMVMLLHDRQDFADRFTEHLLRRNRRIEEDLADQLFNSSEKRLARLLLRMAKLGTESAPKSELPKLSQQTLADMVGTTRSRINYFMNKFRDLGLVERDHVSGRWHVYRALQNTMLDD